YVADNWSFAQTRTIGHDAKAVNAAAKEVGLKTTSAEDEAQGFQSYENMNTFSNPSATVTLANAKRKIYQSLISFMFNGYEYLHAESISGLTNDTRYLGIDLSSRSDANSVHFLLVGDEDLVSESTFDKTAIANDRTTEKLQATYQKAQEALIKAKEANEKAQETLALKQADKNTAEANAKIAQESLEKAIAIPVQTPLAEQAVTLAEEKVKASNEAHQKAQEALKNLEADVKQKQANVEAAKAFLETKEAELKALQQIQSADEKVLEQAKMAKAEATLKVKKAENILSELKEKLAEANNDLKALLDAPTNLKKAQVNLKLAVAHLEDKKSVLATAITRLEELKVSEQETINHYQVVLKAYQELQEAKRQEQLAREREAVIKSGQTPIAVTDSTGKVIGYVVLASQVSPVTKSTDKHVSQAKVNLPNTGDSESALGLLGLLLALMSTFGLAMKSKKQLR
uniref:SEC10/PgrA surface exclusion domain-containing protein n=1 Tax=Streptococcus porci TaxID=502567 RepID=UPI00048A1869